MQPPTPVPQMQVDRINTEVLSFCTRLESALPFLLTVGRKGLSKPHAEL